MLLSILLAITLGSLVSMVGGFWLLLTKSWTQSLALKLTSFAAGVLLGTAFLDLFPEAFEQSPQGEVFIYALFGIIFFFVIERTFVWFHHHHGVHDVKPTVLMVLFGDGVHNFIDGMAIAAAFLTNPGLGIATTMAVAAHEIPQEIADFSILLTQGINRKRALIFNFISALTAIMGGLLTYFFAENLNTLIPLIIAFTAGMFIYIALSDLIPELHHEKTQKNVLPHILTFISGIALVYFFSSILEAH